MAIPSRDKIKEALVAYLSAQQVKGQNVTPEMAYEALAHQFHLTSEDLNLRRLTGEEKWPNEVRYARWELVDEGVILSKELGGHGIWKLRDPGTQSKISVEFSEIYSDLEDEGVFNPANISDARDIILRAIVQRRGQKEFRASLLKAYQLKCAVTAESCVGVLEAAHIVPYRGEETSVVTNGLLLRADVHTLFDLFLISVHPSTFKIAITSKLQGTGYAKYHGQLIFLPTEIKERPSTAALEEHWSQCRF